MLLLIFKALEADSLSDNLTGRKEREEKETFFFFFSLFVFEEQEKCVLKFKSKAYFLIDFSWVFTSLL